MISGDDVRATSWMLQGDPAIRWQVMRDLLDRPPREWKAEQSRVAQEGWGAKLLEHQNAAGVWTSRFYGQKWISTTYSLLLLRDLGLPQRDHRVTKACLHLLDEGLWPDGGINPTASQKRSEACVTGFALRLLSWFRIDDPRRERLVDYLLAQQMPDGGWNCQRHQGATHSSFHTTINVLEGLRDYVEADGPRSQAALTAEAAGREFFLAHRLYRSHRTGDVVDPAFTRFSFPPRWHHDVLRTLDYFRASSAPYDDRINDAIELLMRRRASDGRWILQNRHPGKVFFELERAGSPSRWNTLRALRVLKWYGGANPAA